MTSIAAPAVDRWSDISPLRKGPRAAASAAVARRVFGRVVGRLGLTVSTDGRDADIVLHRPEEFFSRIGNDGLIGFGEAYLTGAWDSTDLAGTLTILCAHIDSLTPAWMQRLRAAYVARRPRAEQNTAANARSNIAHHYDLSNDLFATFLDPTMSYSSAIFATDPPGGDLEAAQVRKVETILDAARVTSWTRVLEIGTGWGELAIRAARRGATVRTITLSSEQQELARHRVAAAGVADRVEVDLLDYRAVDGEYDAVLSVEMIEAVGLEYLPAYFETIDRVLAPGGTAAIQAITMPHRRMLATRHTWTWIQKYVFPGGFLPSTELLDEVTRRRTALHLTGWRSFGSHYAETLRQWDAAFLAARQQVLGLGFDETFVRMWHFYLAYARAGFASGYLDVQQLTFTREGR